MSGGIDAIRGNDFTAGLVPWDDWTDEMKAQAHKDRHALLAALDKAGQTSWDSEEYANRKHRALRMQAKKIRTLKAVVDRADVLLNESIRTAWYNATRAIRFRKLFLAANKRKRDWHVKYRGLSEYLNYLDELTEGDDQTVEKLVYANADMRKTLEKYAACGKWDEDWKTPTASQATMTFMDGKAARDCIERIKGERRWTT